MRRSQAGSPPGLAENLDSSKRAHFRTVKPTFASKSTHAVATSSLSARSTDRTRSSSRWCSRQRAAGRELGAMRIGLLAPYLSYMRQDRRFHDGEAVTSTYFARLLSS